MTHTGDSIAGQHGQVEPRTIKVLYKYGTKTMTVALILAEAENRQKLNKPMENSVINGAGV